MRARITFSPPKEPTLTMSTREAHLMTLLIGLVSDKWQGDRLNMLPHHGFTREDVQNLSGRLLEFNMLNTTPQNKEAVLKYPGNVIAQQIQHLPEGNKQ